MCQRAGTVGANKATVQPDALSWHYEYVEATTALSHAQCTEASLAMRYQKGIQTIILIIS